MFHSIEKKISSRVAEYVRSKFGVETGGVKMGINPFDEIALEEALRIREKGVTTELVAVSIGPAETQQ